MANTPKDGYAKVCATGRGWPSPREVPQPGDSPLWRQAESIGHLDKANVLRLREIAV
jgi:hypothetical protein